MPKYTRADETVTEMAQAVLKQFETHAPILDAKVKIDFIFAFPDYDENGEAISNALKLNGYPALGICRKISLKDRAKGMGDAEISIDADWWQNRASEEQQAALLDHELHHIAVTEKRDDLGRPILKIRKHDVQVGWFSVIAQRHGTHSQERIQAKQIMDAMGQFFWPEIAAHENGATRIQRMEVTRK